MSSPFVAYGEEAYQSFKCEGNNVNIDNIEQIQQLQTENNNNNNFDATANNQQQVTPTGAEEGEGEPLNALTGNSNGNGNGEPLLTLKNICLNFGNNENNALITPEPPPQATLTVNKLITCEDLTDDLTGVSVQQETDLCTGLEALITADQFLIDVTGNHPVPPQFDASEAGTVVTLGPGNYVVKEELKDSVLNEMAFYNQEHEEIETIVLTFGIYTGDCSPSDPTEATGTLESGESQLCNIENHFELFDFPE